MKPTVLFLFNSSDYAVQPWLDDGRFNVVSVDYDDTDHSGAHQEGTEGHHKLSINLAEPLAVESVKWALESRSMAPPAFVVSFAPCTDMAVAGAKHFKKKLEADPLCQHRAVEMAQLAKLFGCPYIVENPVSILSTRWRKPDVIVQPHQFAGYIRLEEAEHPEFPDIIPPRDQYKKTTCLWLGNGAAKPLKDSRPPIGKDFPGWQKLGGKSPRTKYIRSLTPRGLSRAIYWANYPIVLNLVVDKQFLEGIV